MGLSRFPWKRPNNTIFVHRLFVVFYFSLPLSLSPPFSSLILLSLSRLISSLVASQAKTPNPFWESVYYLFTYIPFFNPKVYSSPLSIPLELGEIDWFCWNRLLGLVISPISESGSILVWGILGGFGRIVVRLQIPLKIPFFDNNPQG